MNAANLLSATGWFAGLLVIMIFVTVLFGFILVIALKPVKTDRIAGGPVIEPRKLLEQRETELTIALMDKNTDGAKTEELLEKLRQVRSAKEVIDSLVNEELAAEDADAAADARRAQARKAKPSGTKPAAKRPPVQGAKRPAPANPAQGAEKKPAAPAENKTRQAAQPAAKAADAPAEGDNKTSADNGKN